MGLQEDPKLDGKSCASVGGGAWVTLNFGLGWRAGGSLKSIETAGTNHQRSAIFQQNQEAKAPFHHKVIGMPKSPIPKDFPDGTNR